MAFDFVGEININVIGIFFQTWQPTNLAIPLTETEEEKDTGPKTIPTMVPPISIPPLIPPVRDPKEIRERNERAELDIESLGRERPEREKELAVKERERDRDSLSREDEKDRDRSRSQYRHKERFYYLFNCN